MDLSDFVWNLDHNEGQVTFLSVATAKILVKLCILIVATIMWLLCNHVAFISVRCIRKDPYLGHHPEGTHAQVWVHPDFREGEGHCMDRGQQEACCCWGRTREVSVRIFFIFFIFFLFFWRYTGYKLIRSLKSTMVTVSWETSLTAFTLIYSHVAQTHCLL